MDENVVVLVILISTFVLVSEAYKLPSPPELCESMVPVNLRGISPQSSESPYLLTVSHTHIKCGASFDITLTSNSTRKLFKGFMIQVRNDNTSKPIGVFVRTPEAKWLYCSPGRKNVLANNNEKDRRIVKTSWAAPPKFRGVVYAIATVIGHNEKEYWVGHKSTTVKIGQHHGVRIPGYDIKVDNRLSNEDPTDEFD